jgi:hypothetical protein
MDRALSMNWEKLNARRTFEEKPEGKRPLVRLRHRWENNIKMDLRDLERYDGGSMDWIDVAQGRNQ